MLTADSIGFYIMALILFAGGGIGLLRTKRTPTEVRDYVYSPTYSPTMRTAKRSFAALACAIGFELAALGFHSYVHPTNLQGRSAISAQAMRVLDPLDHVILVVAVAVLLGVGYLFIRSTQPLRQDAHENSESPTDGDRHDEV